MAQNLQGLSYEECSTDIAKIYGTHILYSSFWDMRYYTPAAGCYATRTYGIHLYTGKKNMPNTK